MFNEDENSVDLEFHLEKLGSELKNGKRKYPREEIKNLDKALNVLKSEKSITIETKLNGKDIIYSLTLHKYFTPMSLFYSLHPDLKKNKELIK